MPESFAGITVPEGEPGAVRNAASTFRSLAGGLHGVSGDLQTVPGLVGDWQGLAAGAFHGTVPTNGSCIEAAAEAMSSCAEAARTYADELEAAQKEAEAAIEEARDAQRRIDQAERDLDSALSAQITASEQMLAANARLGMGVPDPGAVADLDAASQALSQAQTAEADARRRLEQAQDDLERAQQRGNRAEKDAKEAARAAAGAFEGVAGGSPAAAVFGGSPSAIEGEVLARVRAGDYSVLETVPMNYLPEDTQRAIGAEVAKDADQAAVNEGDHSFEEMKDIAGRYGHDEEFATGFYNQLGGSGARDFVSNVATFQSEPNGWDDPDLVGDYGPFAVLLGTATRAGGLHGSFTGGFLRREHSARDRLGGHNELKAFVMAGEADNYSGKFLADVGDEVLIEPLDPENEDIAGHVDIAQHQDLMKFMAGNPEAAGTLLAGRHGPENHFSNAGALMLYGPRYTDEGEALGALVNAGAHDLRGTNPALANQAAHAVIQSAPPHVEHLGDKAKPALVTILDDHITNFEYVATERASENLIDPPAGRITTLTYEEAFDYLKALVGDDETRHGATTVVGHQVADSIQVAIGLEDTSYANSAGALSEMGVLATAEANLDDAKRDEALNNFAKSATGKIAGFTPPGKVPFGDVVINQALDEIFSTDQVEKALEQQTLDQLQAHEAAKRLTIATQVEMGHLPEASLQQINPNGTLNVDFIDGPGGDEDIVKIDTDGDKKPDTKLVWDLDRDGTPETNITERELYDAGLKYAQATSEGISSLQHVHHDGTHPPDIDELDVPDGLEQDNPNFFENLNSWPFDAPGENEIMDGDNNVVANQDDLKWDPDDQVYRLPVEIDGQKTELTYQRFKSGWERVELDASGRWVPVD